MKDIKLFVFILIVIGIIAGLVFGINWRELAGAFCIYLALHVLGNIQFLLAKILLALVEIERKMK